MLHLKLLSQTMATIRENLGAVTRLLYDDLVKHLRESDTAGSALRAGDPFPRFALPDASGRFVTSDELFEKGPVAINFYRGHWCPFCSATLAAMSAKTPAIRAAGASVIGISPELGHLSLGAGREPPLAFDMLYDLDNGLALECGLLFRLTDALITRYADSGLDLTQVYGNGSWFLPIPATYIVEPNGIIAHAFVDPDFRYRMEPEDIVRVVQTLTGR